MAKTLKYPYYFVLPALLIYLLLSVSPKLMGIYYSFTDWNIHVKEVAFIGLDNYKAMLADDEMVEAFKNTIIFSFFVTIFQNVCGLGLALLLNAKLRMQNVLRTVFFLPYVIAPIITGYIFTALYHPDNGLVNAFLRLVGLGVLAQDWLNDPKYALFSVIVTDIWRLSGFAMVIYLAGLQIIPKDLTESAQIDGASFRQRFVHITFPLLAPSFTVNLLLSMIGSMKVFELVMVLTRGGPGYATQVFNTYILGAFSSGIYGYGTAVNVVLFLVITAVGIPVLVGLRRRELEM
ncbi:carbohydrate ABC transporter permease [Paenibacillus piri]|uniref:Sugar ABC transporter permease n=1 Tax=Paenibacillus piri TaxID=2547395 RepID=A0A4R5KA05_9BACL|nr:sugar ABC transporter permease [Paenibacillus piri]TDF90512.1 sugar ABC transporter permease [Paenibacillus piri]